MTSNNRPFIVGRHAFAKMLTAALESMSPEELANVKNAHELWVSRFADHSWIREAQQRQLMQTAFEKLSGEGFVQ